MTNKISVISIRIGHKEAREILGAAVIGARYWLVKNPRAHEYFLSDGDGAPIGPPRPAHIVAGLEAAALRAPKIFAEWIVDRGALEPGAAEQILQIGLFGGVVYG